MHTKPYDSSQPPLHVKIYVFELQSVMPEVHFQEMQGILMIYRGHPQEKTQSTGNKCSSPLNAKIFRSYSLVTSL